MLSGHKPAMVIVICFVALTSIPFAIFIFTLPYQLDGAYLGLFGAGIIIGSTIIYYKVSGKPLPISSA